MLLVEDSDNLDVGHRPEQLGRHEYTHNRQNHELLARHGPIIIQSPA